MTGIKGRMFDLFAKGMVDHPERWNIFIEDRTANTLLDVMSKSEPYWARAPLDRFGIFKGSLLAICDPRKRDEHGASPRKRAFGIAVNDDALLEEILQGPGKQPNPPHQAGFLELVTREMVAPAAFRHLIVASDMWSRRPLAGRVLMETSKTFNENLYTGDQNMTSGIFDRRGSDSE